MRAWAFLILDFIVLAWTQNIEEELLYDTFPLDFQWGVATSAYQV